VADCSYLVWTPQQCTDTLPKTVFQTSWYSVMYEERSEMIRTVAAVSANKRLLDRVNYHRIVQSEYSAPPSNGSGRACLWKTAFSLPSLVAEAHGQELWNGRRLLRAWIDHVYPAENRRPTVRYSSSVICNFRRDSTCTQHSVQLETELPQCQVSRQGSCLWVISRHSLRLVLYSHAEDPKETAAMYITWERNMMS